MSELDHSVVSLRFSEINLDPKIIGELLGFIQSETTVSTIKRLTDGRVVWSIRYTGEEMIPLEKKIEALLTNFTTDIRTWNHITDITKADIFCGLFLDGWNQGFTLTPRTMKILSGRNLEIGFDIFSPTDDS
jgi:hypothetical protein